MSIAGKVFLRLGPLTIRRGRRYPEVICYLWREREIVSSAKWYVIFNIDGTHPLSLAFIRVGPRIWVTLSAGHTTFEWGCALKGNR